MAVIEWFFTETIYGPVALALPIYGLAFMVKKITRRAPQPFVVAVLGFLLLLATLPSYSRFKFERDVLAILDRSPHARIVATARYGNVLEPITWFYAPMGFVHAVSPNSPLEGGGFRRVIWRYGEEPTVTEEEPDCEDFTILIAAPDSEGTLRYTTAEAQPMSPQDRELFCETDWIVP